ncbi:HAD-IIIA family hydrolase [Paenactinomyces guangxiensis]|uniref:D,D-heptose 1,7-bisphosphate phosphatase n=1 Tax=Paenactinomyces guangxiensis TaxID=1490290 RepID=A0A7W2A9I7_9BACL|nr:HAD-IIIA family hydrolase [Paenactinomyces guangxiensis]MBA4494928.1 HAD-IIIA family hydrolase [Paenactinomyces guangxiensis]MBH8592011.1 HAD-IIIA family hydrolase [Paenactinomyces guangxiensis]
MKNIQAVFIDRDGTIGGTGHFIHPKDFTPYPFSKTAFQLLKDNNIKMFAFTNQHRISRGEASVIDFYNEFKTYGFDDVFICPHSPSEGCECHKPKPGLLLDASRKHNLDLSKTCVIGDVGSTDMLAAHAVGAFKILVLTGWGKKSFNEYRHTWESVQPDFVAENLLDAVRWIINKR